MEECKARAGFSWGIVLYVGTEQLRARGSGSSVYEKEKRR